MFEVLTKQRQRAARLCRLHANRLRIGNKKINYLEDQKERRRELSQPARPFDWQDIVQRSKAMAISSRQKPITFISHLRNNHAQEDSTKQSGRKYEEVPQKRTVKTTDDLKITIMNNCVALIKYISRLRRYPYVCQTEKTNYMGTSVISNFYADELGNTMSDAE